MSSSKNWADYDGEEDDIIFNIANKKFTKEDEEDFPELVAGLNLEDSSEKDSSDASSDYFSDSQDDTLASSSSPSISGSEVMEPYDVTKLPPHACKYCGIHAPACVARCNGCNRWFCNGKSSSEMGSHIVQHLVRAKHREISLHPESAVGDSVLECYNCGNKNIFLLGFIPAKADTVVVLLCRQPCASGAGNSKDATWDLENWTPLITQRSLLNWLVSHPSEKDMLRARPISSEQIIKLEELWKSNANADLADLKTVPVEEVMVCHVQQRYDSAYEYHAIMSPLVALEAEQDKNTKEAQRQENITIRWDIGLNMKRLAWFSLPVSSDADFRIAPGDEVVLSHSISKWRAFGNIVKNTGSISDEIAVELAYGSKIAPTETAGYQIEFVWKSTPYDRMQKALKMLAHDDRILEPAILHEILGQGMDIPDLSITMPSRISAPGLPELNHSQAHAVRHVLSKPLSLIQGPPGTGKTVTSATIVYHFAKMGRGPVLVCAPSNVAVDHLTEKIHLSGLRVVRIAAKWREDVDSSVSFLSLHSQIQNCPNPELRKFIALKNELGELSAKDEVRYLKLKLKAEGDILKAAQVICTTTIGAGDRRLAGLKFSAVLLDEATQAVEPESLIPLMSGPRQVVLVGDHRQLGPVVLNKKVVKAGFNQSLFERLISLGLRPVRLQVQYRMHPCLAEFPSNMFYDGSLQNGVTAGERMRKGLDFPWPNPEAPMFFLSCIGPEELSSSGTSFLNRAEASQCERVVTRFLKAAILPSQIGVITPYDGQRAFLQHYLQTAGTLRKELYNEIEIASVDAFQGREKDYILLSCVRSNDVQNIGFLSDARRLNVALTRAKYGIVILGNPKVLSRNHLWHHLVSHFKEKGLLVEGTLGNLRPSLLQLARPRPLQITDVVRPVMPNVGQNIPNSPYPLYPTIPSSVVSLDTISQSGFETLSISSYSQFSQASFATHPTKSRYFPDGDA